MGRKRKLEINSNLVHANESSNSSGNSSSHHSALSMIQRSAANDRERTRMRVLSKAFVRLKTSLPWVPADTKLSKLDTLKLATSYISYLTHILQDDESKLSNFDTAELFQTTGLSFQKFNLNIKSLGNIRFSHTDKHKKIIENLAAVNNMPPISSFSNGFNTKINSSNSHDDYDWGFDSSNKNNVPITKSAHLNHHISNTSSSNLYKQIYLKEESTSPCYYSSNNNFTNYSNYNQTFS